MTRPTRSRPFQRSQNSFLQPLSSSSSRPFLHMLNPLGMSRAYAGYSQANQSPVEEEGEEGAEYEGEDRDLEAQRGPSHGSTLFQRGPQKSKVPWGASTQMDVLRPNVQKGDKDYDEDSSDDEVPQSFMIEAHAARKGPAGGHKGKGRADARHRLPPEGANPPQNPVVTVTPPLSIPPRPSEIPSKSSPEPTPVSPSRQPQMRGLDAYERALWNWVNVYNLDAFLQEVYYYYEGKGIYSIALARGLNLLTVGFVIGFSTFLLGCVDYSRIRPEQLTRLSDVVVERCVAKFSGFTLLFFVLFTTFYCFQIVSFLFGIKRLGDMYNFYTHLLKIPDADIQTIAWPEVVRRIRAIREENPLTAISSSPHTKNANPGNATSAKLDAHDVANRIMRQENYLIALFNKELLNLQVPLPHAVKRFTSAGGTGKDDVGQGRVLTRALEWNLRFCLMEYLFDAHGRVRKVFLKHKNRTVLIEGLKRRFIFMGILNAIFVPFIVLYLLMYSFFRYFDEYHKNPSSIGGRKYTPFARWKFREFNELPHLFERRLRVSYPAASMYIGQFPNEKMTLIVRFVAFVAGSFAAVLLLASLLDPDLFLNFEITPHGTVLFYIGVFTSILVVVRGMIPEEHMVFDPELLMTEVIQYTHYMPDEWKGMLHSKRVHSEFGELFAMKILTFVQEIVSVVLTPFVLWISLPPCAPAIIDFFRDFTIHIEGRGYVCSFAEFDFHRHGNVRFGAPAKVQDQRMISKEGKMEKSFLNFKAANPDWNPLDPSGSLYLDRMSQLNLAHGGLHALRRRHPTTATKSGQTMDGTVLLHDSSERTPEYGRALKQSQSAALRRRQSAHLGASMVGPPVGSSSVFQSTAGLAAAQTAVLGDSQGSIAPSQGAEEEQKTEILSPDENVGSELGESYIDGEGKRSQGIEGEEEEILEDGGVLRLLAQIYGTGGTRGRARVL